MMDKEPAPVDDPVNEYTSDSSENEEKSAITTDEANFHPNRVFYIDTHYLMSKEICIYNVTSEMKTKYQGGEVPDDLRDEAKEAAKSMEDKPTFSITKEHRFFGREFTMFNGKNEAEELAFWKHPRIAVKSADISFPSGSVHGDGEITMSAPRYSSRTNQWAQNGKTYEWNCDSKWKTSRQSLWRVDGSKKTLIGRYAQRTMKFGAGGVLLIDAEEISEVMGVLSICVMLRRMLQREAARSNAGGGASAGAWAGGA